MDQIIINHGLQHINENILMNLDFKNLKVCQSVNRNFKEFLANPIFWLKKFKLITKNPGLLSLLHISEDIFLDFDLTDLEFLESVNENFAKFFNQPMFWLKKCIGLENFTKLRLVRNWVRNFPANPNGVLLWDKIEEELAKKIQISKDTEYYSIVWSYVKKSIDKMSRALDIDDEIKYFRYFIEFTNIIPRQLRCLCTMYYE